MDAYKDSIRSIVDRHMEQLIAGVVEHAAKTAEGYEIAEDFNQYIMALKTGRPDLFHEMDQLALLAERKVAYAARLAFFAGIAYAGTMQETIAHVGEIQA